MCSAGAKRSMSYCVRSSGRMPKSAPCVIPFRATKSTPAASRRAANSRYVASIPTRRFWFLAASESVRSWTQAGIPSRAVPRSDKVSRDRSQNVSAARHSVSFRRDSGSRRGSRKCNAASTAAALTGSPGQFGQGFANLEIVPQRCLHTPGVARREDLAEEGPEIRVWPGNAPVRMVEDIEAFRPELDRAPLGYAKPAQQREIKNVIAGPGDKIAAGVAERKRRGRGESRGVEEVVRRALVARQRDALAGHDIGTIGRARIRKIQREVERVERRAVLQRHGAAGGPSAQQRPRDPRLREPVDIGCTQTPGHIEERQAALQPKIPLVLRAYTVEKPRNRSVRIVDRFGPDETRQERKPARQILFYLHLKRVV